jgi:transposase
VADAPSVARRRTGGDRPASAQLDRLAEDLAVLDREIAEGSLDDGAVKRLMTIIGVNLTVATGIMAAIGDIRRFNSPGKLVSYFGLNPQVRRRSGLVAAHHGRISKVGRSHARATLVEAVFGRGQGAGPLHAFFVRIRSQTAPSGRGRGGWRASWRCFAGTS